MKKIIFQESFLVTGIMCLQNCGNTIQNLLQSCINDCIQEELLPSGAQLTIYAEPNGLGIHRLIVTIESVEDDFIPADNFHATLSAKIKENICFDILDKEDEEKNEQEHKINWINIAVNLLAIAAIIYLTFLFPPSILLTVTLAVICFVSTAYTARGYLFNFFRNLRSRNFANMSSTISLGWFLALAHTLFHTITMPLISGFSMIFMNFVMPIILITCINGMDEIKRHIMEKSKTLQLKGLKTLFPQMAEKYRCFQLSPTDMKLLSEKISPLLIASEIPLSEELGEDEDEERLRLIDHLLTNYHLAEEQKTLLQEGMLIEVQAGECFPVDCILVAGSTIVDASLLTGEPQQSKQLWQDIPAGAINLGQKVVVYATKNSYNSTVNSLLFRANRARKAPVAESVPKFAYFYTALVAIGIIAAICIPVVFGTAGFFLVMLNVIGILFSICPCTITIAHQLPNLLSIHHRNSKGLHLNDEGIVANRDEIHTIVFDKTGTLTTGNPIVESSNIPEELWMRVYLTEKIYTTRYGMEHPLAKAIINCYEANADTNILFNEIKEVEIDPENRGLCAIVQGKKIHIGNAGYLRSKNIALPEIDEAKIEQGLSPVCVAENNFPQGVIYIKPKPRKGVLETLSRLKREGKKIIMLTGDNALSARGFNKQLGSIFEEEDIHAGQTPKMKEAFLEELMKAPNIDPKGVWFVGDGLNDAPSCRMVTENGGVSCAIEPANKSAFFTSLCLNGSLDYLFHHNKLNHFLHQNVLQNQGILTYGTVAFLAFIISFSITGIAVSPLIPMALMISTTLFVLFNSYRTQLSIDTALDKTTAWPKKFLASHLSLVLLLGASSLLICSVLAATLATGGLALPIFAFTAGTVTALCSVCSLSAIGLFSVFSLLLATTLIHDKLAKPQGNAINLAVNRERFSFNEQARPVNGEEHSYGFQISRLKKNTTKKEAVGPLCETPSSLSSVY